ncbi:type II toxin-antitoxin system VapC family toxin [Ferruginibacter sp.]|jgi:PIN domain nuclease of toxin-antitoxin system
MSQFLLDTQIVLWMAHEPEKISEKCYDVILDKSNDLLLSYASIWELSIKLSVNKLQLKLSLNDFISREIEKHNLILSPISLLSIYHCQLLPLIHRDPFDRIIAAHSIVEKIPLISSDKIFDDYNIKRIW